MDSTTLVIANTTALVAFVTNTLAIPAYQLPEGSEYKGEYHHSASWKFEGGQVTAADDLAGWIRLRSLTYGSPFEFVLTTPEQYVTAGLAVLWAIPTIVARFSRLRTRFARDRLDRDAYEALREVIQQEDFFSGLGDQAFEALFRTQRAVTEDDERIEDSDVIVESEVEEDDGFGDGSFELR